MTVKEIINELSKYSSDLEVQTEVFDSIGFLCDGLGESFIDDIVKVSCDEDNNMVILSNIEWLRQIGNTQPQFKESKKNEEYY